MKVRATLYSIIIVPQESTAQYSYHLNDRALGSPSQAHLYHGFDCNTHLNVCFLSVTSWDGGENSVDNSVGEPGRKRQRRDSWDDEYDRGKVTLYRAGEQQAITT